MEYGHHLWPGTTIRDRDIRDHVIGPTEWPSFALVTAVYIVRVAGLAGWLLLVAPRQKEYSMRSTFHKEGRKYTSEQPICGRHDLVTP